MLQYPRAILHAVVIQIQLVLTGDAVVTRCRQSLHSLYNFLQCKKKNVLYTVIVRRVCECSLLQLVKVYGFCEDEERS